MAHHFRAGRRAHARGRHRRRQPRADRRGRRPGRARPCPCRSAPCASPSCTCRATRRAPGGRRAPRARSASSSSRRLPLAGLDRRDAHRVRRHVHQPRPAWPPARRGLTAADTGARHRRVATAEVEQLLEWLAAKTPGAAPQRAGAQPAARRHHPGRARRHRRAARAGSTPASVTVSAFGLREGLLLEMVGAEPRRRAADPLRAHPRVRRALPAATAGTSSRCARWRSSSTTSSARRSAAPPEERRHARGGRPAARRRPAGELPEASQAQLPAHHARRPARTRRPRPRLVALVSRYHRRTAARKKHDRSSPRCRRRIRPSSAGRAGCSAWPTGSTAGTRRWSRAVTAELTRKKLVLRIAPRLAGANMALEGWAAPRKADVLEKVLGGRSPSPPCSPAPKARRRTQAATRRRAPRRS